MSNYKLMWERLKDMLDELPTKGDAVEVVEIICAAMEDIEKDLYEDEIQESKEKPLTVFERKALK